MSNLCEAFGLPRAGFYAWRRRVPGKWDQADAILGEEISVVFTRSRRSGSQRLHQALRRTEHVCRRHRVARLRRGQGPAGRVRGRRSPRTTESPPRTPHRPQSLRLTPKNEW